MAYEHQPGKGTLGKAKTKTKDTSPDMTGKIKWLDGQEYWISAWVKKAAMVGSSFPCLWGSRCRPWVRSTRLPTSHSLPHQSIRMRSPGMQTLAMPWPSPTATSRRLGTLIRTSPSDA
jgi:hypothetical protein